MPVYRAFAYASDKAQSSPQRQSQFCTGVLLALSTTMVNVQTNAKDGGLVSCLRGANVPDELIKKLCDQTGPVAWENLNDLFQAPTNRTDPALIKGDLKKIMTDSGYPETTLHFMKALGRLNTAWEAAKESKDQQVARRADASDPTRPLDEGEQALLKTSWQNLYHMRLPLDMRPSWKTSSLIYRMIEKKKYETISVSKLYSAALVKGEKSQDNPAASKRMGLKGTSFEFDVTERDELPEVQVNSVTHYYFQLRLLANAMAFAGSHKATSVLKPGDQVTFAPLDINLEYADFAFKAALRQPRAAIEWLRTRDLKTRSLMTDMMLEDSYPQGEALKTTMEKTETYWGLAEFSTTLPELDARAAGNYNEWPQEFGNSRTPKGKGKGQKNQWSAPVRDRGTKRGALGPWGQSAAKRLKAANTKGGGKGKSFQNTYGRNNNGGYVQKLKSGITICRDWNMHRCKNPCSKRDDKGKLCMHVCNWEMPDGNACEASDHTSKQHPQIFGWN